MGAVTPEQVKNEYFCNSLSILSMLLGKGGGEGCNENVVFSEIFPEFVQI